MMRQLLFGSYMVAGFLASALVCQTQTSAVSLRQEETALRGALRRNEENGTRTTDWAEVLNRLGVVLQEEGKLGEAEACYRQAASIFEASLGAQHPYFAISLANDGAVLAAMGRYDEAYRLIRRGIDIAVPALGDCSPEVARMYGSLAQMFHRQWKPDRALPVARRVLACLEKEGPESADTGRAHLDLAVAYFENSQDSLAKEHLDLANAIFSKSPASNQAEMLFARNVQLGLYYKLERFKEARELGLQVIEKARESIGSMHPALAVVLANVGIVDHRLKLYQEAAECFQQAIAIQERVNAKDPYVAELLRRYASVLRDAHRKPEAKQVESRAKTILGDAAR